MVYLLLGFSVPEVIVLSDSDPDPVCEWWIEDLNLYSVDYEVLIYGKELNDSLINAAQVLLDAQFPNIEGFQNTIWGHNLDFKPVTSCKPSVQILHTGMLHINFLCTLALSQAFGFIWGINVHFGRQRMGGPRLVQGPLSSFLLTYR